MKEPIFRGASVAIVTPFLPDGKVNYPKLDELLDFQIASGIAAITICGTTGESSTLSTEEHLDVVVHTIDYVAGRTKVIAGTGSNDTEHGLHMSKVAADAGADALLSVTPYYNKTTQKGLLQHYTYIADRVSKPLILYNVPSRTGLNITVDTYRKLAEHPNINGVKEASGNLAQVVKILAACGDNFNVWSGNDDEIAPMVGAGALGVISVLANICPKETVALTNACLDGDYATGRALQYKYTDLIEALFCETNPIPVKTAMNLLGYEVGGMRMPLCEMEPKNQARLEASLRAVGLLA